MQGKKFTMGKKVYDPIHDVFQDQEEAEILNSSPVKPKEGDNTNEQENYTKSEDEEEANDSTESEDNTNVMSDATTSMVPSVATNRKKMKESSKYNRHLKKPDGEFFSRSDLQFHFMYQLLVDKRLLFTNIFKDVYAKSVVPLPVENGKVINVTDSDYDARTFIFNEKLTFSQIYILTLASSTKCSKVLRDKLLLDQQVAFSTCILGLLVNVGRLNTTINFYLEMTSQLRTFHSVPVLQYKVTDLKSLQDTPRLKSILKNLPVGNEPIDLSEIYERPHESSSTLQGFNIVNILFTICDNVSLVNLKLISKYVEIKDEPISLFNILDFPGFEPADRCNVLLWLLYIHAETDLSDASIQESMKLFTEESKIPLEPTEKDYDVDPQEEYEFGMGQKSKRREFLQKIKQSKKSNTDMEIEDPSEGEADIENDEKNEHKQEESLRDSGKREEAQLQGSGEQGPNDAPIIKEEKREPNTDSDAVSRSINHVKTESSNRIDKLIEMDQEKIVGKVNGKPKKQVDFLQDLTRSQKPVHLKRKDLGLIKVFNEYEDIPMASVIGIRGKKRKRFRDNVLGFETDYLKNFAAAKSMLLRQNQPNEETTNIFQL